MKNKALLLGRLGNDPELRPTNNGGSVASVSLATSETWIDKATSEKKQRTQWHKITFFGRQAEIAAQYLKKGDLVDIEGTIIYTEWEKDGVKMRGAEINVNPNGLTMMPRSLNGGGDSSGERTTGAGQNSSQPPKNKPVNQAASNNDFDDDIPFYI